MSESASTIPVSVSQGLFWAGSRLSPDSPLYNMAFRIDFHASLQPAPFAAAIDAVVSESDALRSVFTSVDGVLTARVLEEGRHRHRLVDLAGDADPEAAATAWIEERMRHSFDLGETTFDSALLRLGDERWTWLLNQHHIATDAWSASLVYRRVGEHYARHLGAGEGPGAPLPAYADHVRVEQQELETRQHAAALEHWRKTLDGAGPRLSLYGQPVDDRRGASRRLRVPFGEARMGRLERLAGADGVRLLGADMTRFALLATACVAYLARVSGERAIAFGAATHNRRSPADRDTIGLFVELFPLTAQLEPGATFRSLFGTLAEEARALLLYGRPGASSPATARQFNVILNYLHVDFGRFAGLPTRVEWVDPRAVDPGHAVRFNVHDFSGRGELELGLDLNGDLFDQPLLDRMPGHFLRVLDGMLDDFDAVIEAVPLAGEDDASILDHTEPVPESLAGVPTVVSLLDRQVEANPDAVALQLGEATVTYAQLQSRSEALARALVARGVGAGDIVGICARRSPELVVAVFGVLRSGAAFAPLEPDLPTRRLNLILEDTGARIVVVDENGARAVATSGVETVLPLSGIGDPAAEKSGVPGIAMATGSRVDPAAPAYVFYTSGSTGRPKGVVVEHAGLADYILWSRDTLCPPGPVDFPLFSAFGFDLTVDSLFVPFASGGRLVIYPEPLTGTDLSVRDVFADDAVDVVKLTPSHLALVVETAGRTERIQTLLFSGEELKSDLAARGLAALGSHVTFINEYGPTEAIVGCTWHRFDLEKDRAPGVSIGVPGEGASIYLLDEGMNPVPVHVEGEVYIGGDRLARGYLGRDALTAERFLPDPFRPGGRMYRTGDRALWDGASLHYKGRSDGQIKIRGNRIEMGEVEHAVSACTGVGRSVVSLVRLGGQESETGGADATGGGLRLAAYYTADGSVSPDELRHRLSEVLTDAMIPSFFVELDEIPITPNGKIDRAALPDPREGWTRQADEFRPPESEVERVLAGLWGDVLDLNRVGLDDNFFHLGGDSIAVIQVVDRARARGVDVDVADLFERPSLAALARCVAERGGPAEPEAPPAPRERFALSGLDQAGLDRVAGLLGGKTGEDDGS